ncbi:MAG: LytTR family transcriptional regulator [Bacteroidales bacterium]|nr:LytTR family transcriptional regulator [Bacteroidales bacterium]MBQ1683566.1 LytTR family transcriptional regulator [Bacteroidales bacterium]
MHSLKDQFPKVLLGKHQLIMTVTFAAFFSLVFLLVSVPFSHNAWFNLGRSEAFLFTVVFYAISLAIVCFSKVGQYIMRNSENFTYLHFILWDVAEVLVIALLYTFFTLEGHKFGIINLEHTSFWPLFLSAVVYTTISLAIPYVLSGQYFMLEEKDNTIRLMNYDNVVSDAPAYPVADRRITLFDNSGVLKFSIHSDNLYFIESDDNYIQVWYTDSTGTMKKYMLRCRLKTVEDSFADSDLVRCHRKFIVNIRKVRLLSSSRDGYILDLENDATPQIPVSKTYEQAVLARFNSRI